jgi:hypothetical protein
MTMSFPPTSSEWLGWAAALLTLLTFVCRDMRRLRLLALAANATFIAYGVQAQLLPVLVLHLVLAPVNLWRLNEALRVGGPTASATVVDVPARLSRGHRGRTRTRRGRAWSAAPWSAGRWTRRLRTPRAGRALGGRPA